jgi:putative transposase
MRRSRFSEEQIASFLRQVENGEAIANVCSEAGVSIQTFYRWRSKFGTPPSDEKGLRKLREENSRLRRLVADLSLDKELLQGVLRRTRLVEAKRRHAPDRSTRAK